MIRTLRQAGFGGIGQDCILQYFFAFLVRLSKSLKSELFMAKIRKCLQPKLNSIFWLMPKFRHNQIKESSHNQSTKFGQNHTSEFGKNRSYGCLKLNTNSVNFLSKESLSCKKPINMNWRHWWAGQKLLILQYFFAFLVRLSKSLKSELFLAKNKEMIATKLEFWLKPKFTHNQITESSQNQSNKFGQSHTPEFGQNQRAEFSQIYGF